MKRLLPAVLLLLAACGSVSEIRNTPEWGQVREASTNRILGTALPKDFRTIFILPVYDDSGEETAGQFLYDTVTALFRQDGRLLPVAKMDEAQGVLALKIVRVLRQTQTWDENRLPDTVLVSAQVRFLVRDLEQEKDLLQTEMEERESYNRVTEPVEDEPAAMERLWNRISTNVVRATLEGFY